MTWVKLDDGFSNHPKVQAVGQPAAWLFVAGLCYCSQYLTDGFIADTALPGMGRYNLGRAKRLAEALVEKELWERRNGGYQVHDYLEFQPSRAEVEHQREMKRRAGRAGGQARAKACAEARGQAGA